MKHKLAADTDMLFHIIPPSDKRFNTSSRAINKMLAKLVPDYQLESVCDSNCDENGEGISSE